MADGNEWLWEMARGFQPSRILLTAVELGVFRELGPSPKTSADIAATLQTDSRATDRLCNALVVLRLLEKEGDLFRNSEETQEFLTDPRPGKMASALMHTVHMWDTWSNLTESVRRGTAVHGERAGAVDWTGAFIGAMEFNASRRAPGVVASLNLSGVRRLLDVGGGSGAYSIAFCRAVPDLEATVFDLPSVVPLTRQYAEAAGFRDRIHTVCGDYTRDELGRDFDMALLSAVIHSNSPETNRELFARVFRALKTGGRIVVQDFLMDESRTKPPHGAIFALNMLVGTGDGDTFTQAEVNWWLEEAGFSDIRRTDPPESGTGILIGVRP